MIEEIMSACSCTKEQAEEYLESAVANLIDNIMSDDIINDSEAPEYIKTQRTNEYIEDACSELGLTMDHAEYFISRIAG